MNKSKVLNFYFITSILLFVGSFISFFYFTKDKNESLVVLLIYRGLLLPVLLLSYYYYFKQQQNLSSAYKIFILLVMAQAVLFAAYFVAIAGIFIFSWIFIPLFETHFFKVVYELFVQNIVLLLLIAACIYLFMKAIKLKNQLAKIFAFFFIITGLVYFLSYVLYSFSVWPSSLTNVVKPYFNPVYVVWCFLFSFMGATIALAFGTPSKK